MTAPRLFQGMSAHDDNLDGQARWGLEHGKAVDFLILALVVLSGVVALLLATR